MKTCLLSVLIWSLNFGYAQVGIGTTTPSSNAALDITSNNKGLMLPRLGDTGLVSSPSAGLLIYNLNTKSPAFHNGTSWKSFTSTASSSATDSISYTITGAPTGFTNGTFKILALSNGMTSPGTSSPQFQDISFAKPMDINSTGFIRGVAVGGGPGYSSFAIEFNFFRQGSATPYYSIKATNIKVTSYQVGGSIGDDIVQDHISITPVIFGYKNWKDNVSIAWNTMTNTVVTY